MRALSGTPDGSKDLPNHFARTAERTGRVALRRRVDPSATARGAGALAEDLYGGTPS